MLDTEIDGQLLSDLRDTIDSLLQSLAIANLGRWLALLKEVLSASTGMYASIKFPVLWYASKKCISTIFNTILNF